MTLAIKHHHEADAIRDRFEYRLYLAAAFLIFLPAALVGRCLPRSMRPFGRNDANASVIDEARAAARGVAPWIFMG